MERLEPLCAQGWAALAELRAALLLAEAGPVRDYRVDRRMFTMQGMSDPRLDLLDSVYE